jgi:hypothetical protein
VLQKIITYIQQETFLSLVLNSQIWANFLFFIQGGIWNLDNLLTCGIPYANTDGIPRKSAEFRAFLLQKIPRNSAEFRMFFKKFRIPSEVKNALPWTH